MTEHTEIKTDNIPLPNLAKKMIAIMKDVSYIQKTGKNTHFNFTYAKESDVVCAISAAFQKHGIFMYTSILERTCLPYSRERSDKIGNKTLKEAFLVTVKIQVTFVDADSGEQFVSFFYGDGTDSDDKAVYKALTGAHKYALMKTFLIATGDDPEKDHEKVKKFKQPIGPYIGSPTNIDEKALSALLEHSAKAGATAFRDHWMTLSKDQKAVLQDKIDYFKQICEKADALKK